MWRMVRRFRRLNRSARLFRADRTGRPSARQRPDGARISAASQRAILLQRPSGPRRHPVADHVAHLRIPEDIALIGYDDIDFAISTVVPLSSVRQPRKPLAAGRSSCWPRNMPVAAPNTEPWCSPRSLWCGKAPPALAIRAGQLQRVDAPRGLVLEPGL